MRCWVILLIVGISLLISPAPADSENVKMGIMKFDVSQNVDASIGVFLYNQLLEKAVESGKYTVVDWQEIDRVLQYVAKSQPNISSDEAKKQAINQLGIQKMFVGSVTKVGGAYNVSVKVLNLDLTVDKAKSAMAADEKALSASIGEIAKNLFPTSTPANQPGAAPSVGSGEAGRLVVKTEPSGSRIKILNIKQRYEDGMGLPAGRYQVEVSKDGYATARKWVELSGGEEKVVSVKLAARGGDGDGERDKTASPLQEKENGEGLKAGGKYFYTLRHKQLENIFISPDSKTIITLGGTAFARGWDSLNGKLLFETNGHSSNGANGNYSPNSKYFCTEANDKVSSVWNAVNGSLIFSLENATKCEFSNDGKYYKVVRNLKNRVELYRPDNGTLLRVFEYDTPIDEAIFSPSGKKLLVSTLRGSQFIHLDNNYKNDHDFRANKLKYSNDEQSLMLVNYGKVQNSNQANYEITILDKRNRLIRYPLKGVFNSIHYSADFSPDGLKILGMDQNYTMSLYNTSDGRHEDTLSREHAKALYMSGFSKFGTYIFSSSYDGKVILRDARGETLKQINKEVNSHIVEGPRFVKISPDERLMITFNLYEDSAKVWDLVSMQKRN